MILAATPSPVVDAGMLANFCTFEVAGDASLLLSPADSVREGGGAIAAPLPPAGERRDGHQ